MKKIVFPTPHGTMTWELPRGTTAQIKDGPFEVPGLTAGVQDVLGPLLSRITDAMNTMMTSEVSGSNELRDLLRQHGDGIKGAVAEHTVPPRQ